MIQKLAQLLAQVLLGIQMFVKLLYYCIFYLMLSYLSLFAYFYLRKLFLYVLELMKKYFDFENKSWYYIIMETATLIAISLSGLIVSFTGYALIYCFWATLFTTKRSIRRTRGLVEVMSLQYYDIRAHYFNWNNLKSFRLFSRNYRRFSKKDSEKNDS